MSAQTVDLAPPRLPNDIGKRRLCAIWLERLRASVEEFNQYRKDNPEEPVALVGADLRGVALGGADLHGAKLFEVNLAWENLEGANLAGADLRRCNLEGSNLAGACLEGAQMEFANLRHAKLHRASLREAWLRWAVLESAELRDANFTGAYGGIRWNKQWVNLNIHGEKALVEGLARKLYEREKREISPYLHHFLDEENKHMVYFGEFCTRYAGKIYPDKKLIF